MSLVKKDRFIRAVNESHQEIINSFIGSQNKLERACTQGLGETKNKLLTKANSWPLPVLPSLRLIRSVSKDIWFHVYSSKYKHKFHNTVEYQKDLFLREVRFKLHQTRNL